MPKLSEDWLAVLLGGGLLALCLGAVLAAGDGSNPLKPWLASPRGWPDSPLGAFDGRLAGVVGAGVVLLVAFAVGAHLGDRVCPR